MMIPDAPLQSLGMFSSGPRAGRVCRSSVVLFALLALLYLVLSVPNLDHSVLGRATVQEARFSIVATLARFAGIATIGLLVFTFRTFLAEFSQSRQGRVFAGLFLVLLAIVYGLLLHLLSPGLFGPDIGHMLWMAQGYQISDKYSYLATLLATTGLSFTGNIYGVFLLFIMLKLSCVALVLAMARRAAAPLWLIWLCITLFMFSPMGLFFFLYPGRDALFLAAFSLMLALVATLLCDLQPPSDARMIGIGLFAGAVLTMRAEALVAIPFVLSALWVAVTNWRRRAVITGAVLISAFFWSSAITTIHGFKPDPAYRLTAIINPLHAILASKQLDGATFASDIQKVGRVINLDVAQRGHDYRNIALFFDPTGWRRDANGEDWAAFREGAKGLMIGNWPIIVINRAAVFVAANGLVPGYVFPILAGQKLTDSLQVVQRSLRVSDARADRISQLAKQLMPANDAGANRMWLLWSLGLPLALAVSILAKCRSVPMSALLMLGDLARAGAVFLFAPAAFATYYSTLHNGIWILAAVAIIEGAWRAQRDSGMKESVRWRTKPVIPLQRE